MKRPLADKRPIGPVAQRRTTNPSLAIQYRVSSEDRNKVPDPEKGGSIEMLQQMERELKEDLRFNLDLDRIGLEADKPSRSITVRLGKMGTKFRQDNLNSAVDSMRATLEGMDIDIERTEIGIL